jgi:hypothetical protein
MHLLRHRPEKRVRRIVWLWAAVTFAAVVSWATKPPFHLSFAGVVQPLILALATVVAISVILTARRRAGLPDELYGFAIVIEIMAGLAIIGMAR